MQPTNNPWKNLQRKRPLFLQTGFIVALSLVILAFHWRVPIQKFEHDLLTPADEDTEIIPLILTVAPRKAAPKPLPPVTPPQPVPTPEPEPINPPPTPPDIDDLPAIPLPPAKTEPGPPSLIPEIMPTFIGCETLPTETERRSCTDQKLLSYLIKTIRYPETAKKSGITGTVYISFVIGENGEVRDIMLKRGIGGGCDEEAIRAVKSLHTMVPGIQGGKTTSVLYTLPVSFKLN